MAMVVEMSIMAKRMVLLIGLTNAIVGDSLHHTRECLHMMGELQEHFGWNKQVARIRPQG